MSMLSYGFKGENQIHLLKLKVESGKFKVKKIE